MTSFELSKLQGITPSRALSESDRAQIEARARANSAGSDTAAGTASVRSGIAIEIGASVDPSKAPVDTDRVAEIRAALKDGSYPLVPTKIADAIIAVRVGFTVEAR